MNSASGVNFPTSSLDARRHNPSSGGATWRMTAEGTGQDDVNTTPQKSWRENEDDVDDKEEEEEEEEADDEEEEEEEDREEDGGEEGEECAWYEDVNIEDETLGVSPRIEGRSFFSSFCFVFEELNHQH